MRTECQLDQFRVVHQDAHLLAVHKPAALLVHRSPIDRHETRFALQMARDAAGQHVYPVHRLDKATSGMLLFALSPEAARPLADQFARHEIRKTYLALARGWLEPAGHIDHALPYRRDRLADADRSRSAEPQPAQTDYRTLATAVLDRSMGRYAQQRYSLVELQPRTGRKHQLRRHLRHIQHPIIGDVAHGDRHHNHLFHEWRGYHRLYLAAVSLQLTHPYSGERLHLSVPPQPDFQATVDALGMAAAMPL